MKREVVETCLHYVNHDLVDRKNPFKTVTHHRTFETSAPLKSEIAKLLRLDIPNKANMPLDKLLALPVDIYEMIIGACIEQTNSSKLSPEALAALKKLEAANK